jgi:hypothetical protein
MTVSFGSLLPALTKLGAYFKQGMDHYVALKASGAEVTPDLLSMFIHAKMEGWNPVVKGKTMLDPDTSAAASRFLAGVIINLTAGQDAS